MSEPRGASSGFPPVGAGFDRGGNVLTTGAGVFVAGRAGVFAFGGEIGAVGVAGFVTGGDGVTTGAVGFAAGGGLDSGFFAGMLTAGGAVTGGAVGFATGGGATTGAGVGFATSGGVTTGGGFVVGAGAGALTGGRVFATGGGGVLTGGFEFGAGAGSLTGGGVGLAAVAPRASRIASRLGAGGTCRATVPVCPGFARHGLRSERGIRSQTKKPATHRRRASLFSAARAALGLSDR
jgi:hypothetical protein